MAPPFLHPTFFPMFNNGTYSVPYYGSDPFINGYQLTIPDGTAWLSGGTQFTLSPGAARAFTSDFVIEYNPYKMTGLPRTLNLDLNTTGLLGCYPIAYSYLNLTEFAGGLGVYAIGDTSGVNVSSAIVATGNNFLPPGYNVWRRIGTIAVNNTTRQLIQTTQSGYGNDREYVVIQRLIINTYSSPVTFIPINLYNFSIFSSPFVTSVLSRIVFLPANLIDYAAVSAYGFATDNTRLPFTVGTTEISTGGSSVTETYWNPVGKNVNGRNVQYVTFTGAGSSLQVGQSGWRESMGLQLV